MVIRTAIYLITSLPAVSFLPSSHENREAYERGRKGAGSAMQSALLLFLYSSFSQDESYLHEMAQPLVNNMIAVLPDILADTFYQHDILALFYHCVLL